MKDNEVIVEKTEYDEEWYQPYYTCMLCCESFMCDSDIPNYCPKCGNKIIGIKRGYMTSYYPFEG